MYKEVLHSIEAVEIYPIISLGIFFTFFIFLLYRVAKADNIILNEMSSLPLDDTRGFGNSIADINKRS